MDCFRPAGGLGKAIEGENWCCPAMDSVLEICGVFYYMSFDLERTPDGYSAPSGKRGIWNQDLFKGVKNLQRAREQGEGVRLRNRQSFTNNEPCGCSNCARGERSGPCQRVLGPFGLSNRKSTMSCI